MTPRLCMQILRTHQPLLPSGLVFSILAILFLTQPLCVLVGGRILQKFPHWKMLMCIVETAMSSFLMDIVRTILHSIYLKSVSTSVVEIQAYPCAAILHNITITNVPCNGGDDGRLEVVANGIF